LAVNSSSKLIRYLSNVHTWAISFLRHLANMSSMVPSEHQLTPALSPLWGPRPKPRRLEEVVYSLNDSCSHFNHRLFLPKLPQQYYIYYFSLYIHHHSYLLYITFKQAITSFYYMINSGSFISSALHSRPAALGLLCPIHYLLLTHNLFFPCRFLGFLGILGASDVPQPPAHGNVSSQVATHLGADSICWVLGEDRFQVGTTICSQVHFL
jgi:hypothetical protein